MSIGICAEGNFNCEAMGQAQYNALLELIRSILSKYGISKIYAHFQLCSTDCPGSNFPLDRIKKEAELAAQSTGYPGYLIKMNPGLKDDSVKLIQSKLIEKGYDVGSCGADGYFGKGTLEAIKRFQEDIGLGVDGIVGENTWGRLIGR